MPFPKINYCLVCDTVRPELGGKLTILGFYGAAPNVDIAVGKLDQPFSLTVLLGFGVAQDNEVYNHSVSVINADGSVLFQSPVAKVNTIVGRPGLIVSGAVVIPKLVGPRMVRVVVNGQVEFEEPITIRQATPQELAGMPGASLQ